MDYFIFFCTPFHYLLLSPPPVSLFPLHSTIISSHLPLLSPSLVTSISHLPSIAFSHYHFPSPLIVFSRDLPPVSSFHHFSSISFSLYIFPISSSHHFSPIYSSHHLTLIIFFSTSLPFSPPFTFLLPTSFRYFPPSFSFRKGFSTQLHFEHDRISKVIFFYEI